jgi:Na+-driven multidrug efflux pump
VQGAAIATVLSRCVETAIVVLWTHRHKDKCPYIRGVYRTMRVPLPLARRYFVTGAPLLVNETLWSVGIAMLTQCYSLRGLHVVAAQNISNTVSNVFNVVFFAMGDAIAILVGQHLGAERYEQARDEDNKIIAFAVTIAAAVAVVIFATSGLFPQIYNTTPEAKRLAMRFLMMQALFTPQIALMHTTYFTLRSGGRTVVTFLFDSVYMWLVNVPIAFFLSRCTDMYVVWIFALVQATDWIKCVIGVALVKKGVWMHNIVKTNAG